MLVGLGELGEALNRLREGEELVAGLPAKGIVGESGWVYLSFAKTRTGGQGLIGG